MENLYTDENITDILDGYVSKMSKDKACSNLYFSAAE